MITSILQHPFRGAVILGVFLAGLLWLYIFQINILTTQVYNMGDQETYLEQLKEQSLLLEAQHLPSFSRAEMEELAQELRFERVQQISYLRVLGNTVAATTSTE